MRPLLALLCLACAAPQYPDVSVRCASGGEGRGVVVSPMHVLVSRHQVTACAGSMTADGHPIVVQEISDAGDGALLATYWEQWDRWAIPGPAPVVGERVCSRRLGCGAVLAHTSDGFLWDHQTHPGDSGSGIYDSRGRLVGVVSGSGTVVVGREVWGLWLRNLPRVCLECEW